MPVFFSTENCVQFCHFFKQNSICWKIWNGENCLEYSFDFRGIFFGVFLWIFLNVFLTFVEYSLELEWKIDGFFYLEVLNFSVSERILPALKSVVSLFFRSGYEKCPWARKICRHSKRQSRPNIHRRLVEISALKSAPRWAKMLIPAFAIVQRPWFCVRVVDSSSLLVNLRSFSSKILKFSVCNFKLFGTRPSPRPQNSIFNAWYSPSGLREIMERELKPKW